MRWFPLLLVASTLIACKEAPEPAAAPDAAVVEEDDAAIVVPPLDPARCGAVSGDEAPMKVDASRTSTLAEKAFPLFAELGKRADLLARLRADPALAAWTKPRETRLTAAKGCADAACVEAAVSCTGDEAKAAADATVTALGDSLAAFVGERLRSSGRFNVDAALDDAALVRKAVVDELRWAGDALAEARALDKTRRDAAIDAALSAHAERAFFHPALDLALALLEANGRDEAIRYEPLEARDNAAALAALPSIDWSKYPFAAIVVPGLGPTDLDTALSDGGRQRCELAAARFRARIAPLIVPSGGHVHPDRTKFSEAIEMKRYLLTLGVPEAAIVVDPHARHTTTNLRNVSRLLLRYGAPAERPWLVTTDPFQSLYMNAAPFAQRCRDEIGHVPWRRLTALSVNDSCMFPSRVALTIDARDPLDP